MKSNIDDSVTTCDEVVNTQETKSISSNNDKKATYRIDYFILHTFWLVPYSYYLLLLHKI